MARKLRTPARTVAKSAPAATPKTSPAAHEEDLLRLLTGLLAGSDLTEIEFEKGDLRIRAARMVAAAPVAVAQPVLAAAPAPLAFAAQKPAREGVIEEAKAPAENPDAVKSPMVGTAYLRPNPESNAFVEVGSRVSVGDKLLLIEAMKTFNDIVAPRAGVVTAMLVEDGQPVEYGQPLLVIE